MFDIAAMINAPDSLLPPIGYESAKEGQVFIAENANGTFDIKLLERGITYLSYSLGLEETLYKIFEDVTYQMALASFKKEGNAHEHLRNYVPEFQIELLGKILKSWGDKFKSKR